MYAVRLTTEGGTLVAPYSITYEKIVILFYVFKTNSQVKLNNSSDVFGFKQTIFKDNFFKKLLLNKRLSENVACAIIF